MKNKDANAPAYAIGDTDSYPWGSYTVVAAGKNEGEEYCEKEIILNPGHILPLQSHEQRREHWMVKQGVLTVVLDGNRKQLGKGDELRIPPRAIHCMANLGKDSCVVREVQAGRCRAEDITVYMDVDGRSAAPDGPADASLSAYEQLLADIKKKA